MPTSLSETIVRMHRVESARRERGWRAELERRRREIAKGAQIDLAALRAPLTI